MRKAGGNWVEAGDFFGREAELDALAERVRNGTHTLLTAQRRVGKTSLVRELLRRLRETRSFTTIFVDLEDATTPADAVTEVAAQAKVAQGTLRRISRWFKNARLNEAEVSLLPKLRIGVRGIDAGNWKHRGDQVFAALAHDGPVVLALDELPILVSRLLKGDGHTITPERKCATGEFLSWLRKNGQEHRGKISLILSGSVSLEPILRQAGLSFQTNIFPAFNLKPWDEETASGCLRLLAESYGLDLSRDVRQAMCRLLHCQIPYHVQRFFDVLHEDLRGAGRHAASVDDVQRVYESKMLGVSA